MLRPPKPLATLTALTLLVGGLSACSNPDDKAGDATAKDDSTIVLLDNNETGAYNPLLGYGRSGDSPVYEGLFRIKAPSDPSAAGKSIDLEPVLTASSSAPSPRQKPSTSPTCSQPRSRH